MKWTRKKLIKEYIDFFKKKNHKEIPNSSLVPENDPTVLFTTAGMHPLVPYLLGQNHPLGNRLVSVQKCIRTQDIDDVGDESHLTFFEMLGNWSLGDYFKEDAIKYSFEFLTNNLGIKKNDLRITCFKGKGKIPKDKEAAEIWKNLGIKEKQMDFLGIDDNWWGPAGNTGPCGPDTEMFVNKGKLEIWNDVFMQYNKDKKGDFKELKQKNVDTGMGVERTLSFLQGKELFETELFFPIIKEIEKITKKKYKENKKQMRIIADHIKAAVFILNEKISPSNTEQGYVLRRLIRRAIRYGKLLGMQNNFTSRLAEIVFEIYDYKFDKEFILDEIEKEEKRFRQCIASGLRYFNKIASGKKISGKDAFLLYQSYGFPIELTQEMAKEKKLQVDIVGYEKEEAKHKSKSRTASKGRFKSGLADHSEKTTKYHTAAHLLLAALRQVLGEHVEQRGSNITKERLRLDFSHLEKLSEKEIKDVEKIVNDNIKKKLDVKREEMTVKQAKAEGAMGIFDEKYGEKVSVYSVCDAKGKAASKEICAGPHVTNTGELGKFKIKKQESVGAGVRRIKAVLE